MNPHCTSCRLATKNVQNDSIVFFLANYLCILSDTTFKAVCIVDTHNINFFTDDGKDYVTSSPFPVSKIWPIKSGVLLEMEADVPTNSEVSAIQYPLIFSLRHPYDDIKPVMTKQGGKSVDATTA
jgi:Anaphase-promoting complex subunit 1